MIPTNILILQMLDGKSQPQYTNCSIHKEPKSLYCMQDKIEICKKCASEKAHKGHHVENTSDILSKAATKKNKLKGLLGDFEGEVHTIHVLLEENKKNTLALMKDKFARLRDIINKKEQEIASEIDLFFTREKLQIDNQIHHDLSLRELIRTKIANLSQLEINDKLLKELEDDAPLSNFSSSSQYNVVYSHSKQIQQNIENAFSNLISLAGSVIQEFKPLPEFSILQANQSQKSMIDVISAQNTMAKNLRIEIEFGWLVIYPVRPEDNFLHVEKNNLLNLAKCKELNKVCLDFRKQKLGKEMMASIAQIWSELQNITFVKLLLTNKEFTDQDLCDLCAYNFWCSSQVQSLYLYLITTKVSDNGIKKLSHVIDGQNIKTFAIDCSYSTFTDSCLKELAKNLVGRLKNIESFDLRISNTSVTDSAIEELYRELYKVMPTIKILDLWLDFTAIKERGFEYFNKILLPLGKNVTNLSIHCPKYEGPSANFIKTVLESVQSNLPKLKQLGLYYEKRGLTDETVKFIDDYKKKNTRVTTNF